MYIVYYLYYFFIFVLKINLAIHFLSIKETSLTYWFTIKRNDLCISIEMILRLYSFFFFVFLSSEWSYQNFFCLWLVFHLFAALFVNQRLLLQVPINADRGPRDNAVKLQTRHICHKGQNGITIIWIPAKIKVGYFLKLVL